jgi:integrase
MKTVPHGRGTVRPRKDSAGNVIGFRALLPRHLSTPPVGCKSPGRYQEQIGDLFATAEEARDVLDAAIIAVRAGKVAPVGLPLSHFVENVVETKLTEALRTYKSQAQANMNVSTWRSIQRRWLTKAPFIEWVPEAIDRASVQRFIKELTQRARGANGQPLSGSFVRNVALLLRLAFQAAEVSLNPAADLELPERAEPAVPFMDLPAQRRFFGCDEIPETDRIMAGCAMGAGLRVNELLSFEVVDVRAFDADPHIIVRHGGADRSPTKSRKVRRVELYEPGLGFWRLAVKRFARAGHRELFLGPLGGYLKKWPEQFAAWGELAGIENMTSHLMRHSFAVSVLSGTWGYEPQSLEFLSVQLGHADVRTTQRHYGAFEAGTWSRQVRTMTGRAPRAAERPIITAAELLGMSDAENEAGDSAEPNGSEGIGSPMVLFPSFTPDRESTRKSDTDDARRLHRSKNEQLRAIILDALERIAARDPFAMARAAEALDGSLRLIDEALAEDAATEPGSASGGRP